MSGSASGSNPKYARSMPPPSASSAGHSSQESEGEDESITSNVPSTHWRPSPSSSSQPSRDPAPLQKRRRVTRACDECRRKKIKCDGKAPCTHCTVYSYECTYDQPSNRRRNPAPQYIEALEVRVQRAETIIRRALPEVDLSDPNIESVIQKIRQSNVAKDASQATGSKANDDSSSNEKEEKLRSMIELTGQLELDESGHWDFHGGSSGAVFVRRMREQFGGLLGGYGSHFLPKLPKTMPLGPMYESPRSMADSPMQTGLPNTLDLPPREIALVLCANSLECACALMRFIHQPTFYIMFHRIYDTPPEDFGDEEHKFLALLYVILALGCMFHEELPGEDDNTSYKSGIDQGLKYFKSGRNMMEITDCRDITSLQAIVFMIMFLQSTANLSTCYSYIGIALRSSLRMGLHRNLTGNFSAIERETRRRVFWIIRKMDTYVSAILGFPLMLNNRDIDQELPVEVDDELITTDGVGVMPPGRVSLYAAANAHTQLMEILAKVVKHIYPTKGHIEKSATGTTTTPFMISYVKIQDIERELSNWYNKLPMALRPGGEESSQALRTQQLLRLAYAHVQMMLYRPFLHYVSQKSKKVDDRAYAAAAAGVSVSRNIVHITTEMKKRGLLTGAWFTIYTTFFAILSLVFYVLENPDKVGTQEILADAIDGKEALQGLAKRSQAADRCSMALASLFEQLPERLKTGRLVSIKGKKKRSAQSPPPSASSLQSAKSASEVSARDPPEMGISRARTFPMPAPVRSFSINRGSLDDNRLQSNAISNPNLRQSFQELVAPNTPSSVGTPDSNSENNSMHRQQYLQQFPPHHGLPDLSAMMFPSADPFAYPNQQAFENIKQEDFGNLNAGNQGPPIYLSGSAPGPNVYDDLEGQLFGPMPPYLMQGQQQFDMSQMQANTTMGGLGHDMNYHPSVVPTGHMSFDGIFSSGDDEWMGDPRFRQ